MKAKAKRTDSWLGIKVGRVYETKTIKGIVMVETDGYTVAYNEINFELIEA